MRDLFNRPLRNLRLSVTDRCNLRCEYCMPEDEYVWLPREDLLHFEEISALVDVFIGLGVDRVRLTGGEPLLQPRARTGRSAVVTKWILTQGRVALQAGFHPTIARRKAVARRDLETHAARAVAREPLPTSCTRLPECSS